MPFGHGFNSDQGITGRAPRGQKHIHTESMVAHIWAQQGEQKQARTAKGTVYFKGESIYSYGSHFEIARFVGEHKGRKIVVLDSHKYSKCTGQHIDSVRGALRGITS